MSAAILSAISHLPQLRGSLRHTAQRLAFFADGTGKARKSFTFLARDLHVSERTVKRHVARLQAMLIITKDTIRLTLTRYATNVYTFILGVDHLHKRAGDRVLREEAKREKSPRAREENPVDPRPLSERIAALWKGMGFQREGSIPYNASLEEVRRLEALLL